MACNYGMDSVAHPHWHCSIHRFEDLSLPQLPPSTSCPFCFPDNSLLGTMVPNIRGSCATWISDHHIGFLCFLLVFHWFLLINVALASISLPGLAIWTPYSMSCYSLILKPSILEWLHQLDSPHLGNISISYCCMLVLCISITITHKLPIWESLH